MLPPHLLIPFQCRGTLMTLNPRKVYGLHEVYYCKNSLGGHLFAVDGSHIPPDFVRNICRWPLASSDGLTNKMSHALSLDDSADVTTFPITNIPSIVEPYDLPLLLSHKVAPVLNSLRPDALEEGNLKRWGSEARVN